MRFTRLTYTAMLLASAWPVMAASPTPSFGGKTILLAQESEPATPQAGGAPEEKKQPGASEKRQRRAPPQRALPPSVSEEKSPAEKVEPRVEQERRSSPAMRRRAMPSDDNTSPDAAAPRRETLQAEPSNEGTERRGMRRHGEQPASDAGKAPAPAEPSAIKAPQEPDKTNDGAPRRGLQFRKHNEPRTEDVTPKVSAPEPKVESVKPVVPEIETPKVEAPKTVAPSEEKKVETPKTDVTPQAESPASKAAPAVTQEPALKDGAAKSNDAAASPAFDSKVKATLPVDKAAPAASAVAPTFTPGFSAKGPAADNIGDVQKNRHERTENNGQRKLIEEPGNRVIVEEGGKTFIRHDETARFATGASNVRSERANNGTVETVIQRPNGVEVFNVTDRDGRVLRRYRRDRGGHETNLIDNRSFYNGLATGAAVGLGLAIATEALAPPRVVIPREEYIVEYEDASDDELYETFTAPPVEDVTRTYSLEDVRYNRNLRERTRRVDLDAVNFTSGSWEVSRSQYESLSRAAKALNRAIRENPGEVFMVEGHTDAVGSNIDNLSLSDRRAQSVAQILSDVFEVPPENLVTQGYGEEFLKIPTQEDERQNRRVAIRRITPLIAKR